MDVLTRFCLFEILYFTYNIVIDSWAKLSARISLAIDTSIYIELLSALIASILTQNQLSPCITPHRPSTQISVIKSSSSKIKVSLSLKLHSNCSMYLVKMSSAIAEIPNTGLIDILLLTNTIYSQSLILFLSSRYFFTLFFLIYFFSNAFIFPFPCCKLCENKNNNKVAYGGDMI